jgi:UMF1 family MFS transporter
MFSLLIPPERAGELYGFNAVAGRLSAALGPLLFGAVGAVTGSQRWALLSIVLFFAAGGLLLARVARVSGGARPVGA